MTPTQLHTVRLLAFPVQVWAASQEHHDELMREFALMTAGQDDADERSSEVPVRLLRLVERLTATFAGAGDAQRERLFVAAARGDQVVEELVYELPAAVAPATAELARMLDEADDYCTAGDHLLTLATPPELRLFRDWYLGQVQDQVNGAAPMSWPEFLARSLGGAG